MGYVPEWYQMIRAARYLGVPPWELEHAPIKYFDRALEAERREIQAQNQARKN